MRANCKKSRKPCKCTVSCCYNAQFFRYTICGRFRQQELPGATPCAEQTPTSGGQESSWPPTSLRPMASRFTTSTGRALTCGARSKVRSSLSKSNPARSLFRATTGPPCITPTPPADPVADWYCFVALDRELLLMRPAVMVVAKTTRIAPSEFNEANQRRTIEEMMNSC
jgi:hypothetical protein